MTRIAGDGARLTFPTEVSPEQPKPASPSTESGVSPNTVSSFENVAALPNARTWESGLSAQRAATSRPVALFGLPPILSGPLNGLLDALDVGKNIDQLKPGDAYQLALGANAHVEVGGEAAGQLNVSRADDGGYVVSANGEVGVGLYGQVGAELGVAGASANASARADEGVRMSMRFDNAADAKRGAAILERLALCTNPVAGALPGVRPSGAELKFLADHVSALDLHGKVAADVAGSLGIGKDRIGAAISGSAGANLTQTTRIELDHGRPVGLVVSYEGAAKVGAGAGVGLTLNGGKTGEGGDIKGAPKLAGFHADGQASEDVKLEAHFALPRNVDLGRLVANPKATLGGIARQVISSERDTATVDLQAKGSVSGLGSAGRRAKLQLTGHLPDILLSGALQSAQQFDFDRAAQQAKAHGVGVSGSLQNFHDSGPDVAFNISVMGVGGGIQAAAVRRNYDSALRTYPAATPPPKPAPNGFVEWLRQHFGWFRA